MRRDEQRVIEWEMLDVVEVPVSPGLFVCMGAASRDGDEAEYVVVAQEDPAHVHRVKFAWRIDPTVQKFVEVNPSQVVCNIDECNDSDQ